MLRLHKLKCGEDDICCIRTSNESHFFWKKSFHKNPLFFRIYGNFEADNEMDNSSIGNKITYFFEQNPVLNGYNIVYELADVLEGCHYKSPLGYKDVDWFVTEKFKLENKLDDYFENTIRDIIMTEKYEQN